MGLMISDGGRDAAKYFGGWGLGFHQVSVMAPELLTDITNNMHWDG